MKYALVNSEKNEALKGMTGTCPSCGRQMIAKCGDKKIHHWSHKGKLECDPWWENETPWHRDWKGHFPIDWQEVTHRDEATGEKHIADVKTSKGWILEFQHSYLRPEERKSRNDFYKRIAWVVDGTRLKGDLEKVQEAFKSARPVNQLVLKIAPDICSLFRDWASSHAPVFFDFGGPQLVLLLPIGPDGFFYISAAISKLQFIEIFREIDSKGAIEFEAFLQDFYQIVHQWNHPRPSNPQILQHPQFIRRQPRVDYIQYRNRNRRRF